MEITTIGYLFWFDAITLILCSLKPANKAIMLNIFCALGFVLLGIVHLYPIGYIGFGSPMNVIPYNADPSIAADGTIMQKAAAWFYMAFGLIFLITSILKALTGMEDEPWGIFGKATKTK